MSRSPFKNTSRRLSRRRWGELLQDVTANETAIVGLREFRFRPGDNHLAWTASMATNYTPYPTTHITPILSTSSMRAYTNASQYSGTTPVENGRLWPSNWRCLTSPPPPPPGTLSAQISATTKRGCRPWAGSPWGLGNRGADLLLPLPPPTEMGPDRKRAQHTPPPPHALAPSHSLQAVTWGSRSLPTWTGSRRRTTSMLGSGTRMVTQQVVLLSQTREQVDPSTTTPPPPACAPDGRGARSRRPQGPKSGGCAGLTA